MLLFSAIKLFCVFIVKAKHHIISSKIVVGADWPVNAQSNNICHINVVKFVNFQKKGCLLNQY